MVGMLSGPVGGGGGVEACESAGGPEGVSGDTRPLGAVDMVFLGNARDRTLGCDKIHPL